MFPTSQRHVAVFCRVIDNVGDAGVCWRLARQLANEKNCLVTLFVDRRDVMRPLWPSVSAQSTTAAGSPEIVEGVLVQDWPAESLAPPPFDVLLCTFACDLPPGFRAQVGAATPPHPVWINLDHLSAEAWIEGMHRQRSVKPTDGAIEHYFFPGFTAATGGLLREATLANPNHRLVTRAARADMLTRLCGVGDDVTAQWLAPGTKTVSLFSYPVEQVTTLMALMAADVNPWQLIVPATVASEQMARFFGCPLRPGALLRRGALTAIGVPWLDQPRYDELLGCCDLNFVRGEDSWIRAHWANRPFVWQPYPQAQPDRLAKLDAWLARLTAGWPSQVASDTSLFMHAWAGNGRVEDTWAPFARHAISDTGSAGWTGFVGTLLQQPDLATQLLDFTDSLARL